MPLNIFMQKQSDSRHNLVIISKTKGYFEPPSLYNTPPSQFANPPSQDFLTFLKYDSKKHKKNNKELKLTRPRPKRIRHFPGKMSAGLGKCSKIRHIVRLRQMLRRWRNKARMSASRIPSDVPAGHVAVCVGTSCRRFVVRATYLNHPVFKKLLVQAEEEFGFTHEGPLAIPCDESMFEEVLRFISRSESNNSARFVNLEDFQRYCHVDVRSNLDFWPESQPLINGLVEKTFS